jgi:hypothetical protein
MAYDSATRNRLAHFVADARGLIAEEFTQQFQSLYGISPKGDCTPLEKLPHLDEMQLATAALLRERIQYLIKSHPDDKGGAQAAVERLAREQAFTVLNRFAAIRMAEKRGIIVESIGKNYQSKGFKVYETVAGSGLGEAYHRYQRYLFCLFDELAVDLGVLFDRRSPHALLFPREQALLALLELINDPEIEPLWAEDETVGWIYQYYNDPLERKKMREQSSAPRNSRELAVRNQFFTPRYVVEFLTDNTLGRIWYEMTKGQTHLKEQCRYLVRRPTEIFLNPGESAPSTPENSKSNTQNPKTQEELLRDPVHIPHRPLKDPRSILMLDPACGSMHFGLYAFDLFEVIYEEFWDLITGEAASLPENLKLKTENSHAPLTDLYASKEEYMRDVPRMIIENNVHGIDIDPRCAQIAGLSLWLRAQKAWQRLGLAPAQRPAIKRSNIVCAEPMPGEKELLREFVEREFPAAERAVCLRLLEAIFDKMQLAGEAGSLLKIEEEIRSAIEDAKKQWKAGPKLEQSQLFGGDKLKQQDIPLDYSGLTESEFWDQLEEKIYAALRNYAEQAENGGGFQRRLFAEDAARGFAFIDVCRKRYDTVVMNPPFGSPGIRFESDFKTLYPDCNKNVYCGFVAAGEMRLVSSGRLGCITDATYISQFSFSKYRENHLLASEYSIDLIADLGWGVLDAWVHTALAVISNATITPNILCVKGTQISEQPSQLAEFSDRVFSGNLPKNAFVRELSLFEHFPDKSLLFWLPDTVIDAFRHGATLDPDFALCRTGLNTGDNDRFYKLWWEVPGALIGQGETWVRLANGGSFQPYWRGFQEVMFWENDGYAIREYKSSEGNLISRPQNTSFFFKGGLTYGKRTECLNPQIFPEGMAFTDEGHSIFPNSPNDESYWILGILNSAFARDLMNTIAGLHKTGGYLGKLPVPEVPDSARQKLSALTKECVAYVQKWDRIIETSPIFSPILASIAAPNLASQAARGIISANEAVISLAMDIDEAIASVYGVSDEEMKEIAENLNAPNRVILSEAMDCSLDELPSEISKDLLAYFFGTNFGRWDIRYATGEQAEPELPDPFAPLPVCPPGQLQNAQGLPLGKEEVGRMKEEGNWNYPIEIPWDGILVDDPNHPLDIERRVREVIEIIWTGQAGGPTAEAIEHEACEILSVKSLRDYFRKPAGFFADHLKRYSKSRRQAPIYWPLSTASGSYTLWIYYHRLTDQTLHTVLADFLEPKIRNVQAELDAHHAGGNGQKAGESRDFLDELKDLRDEIERIIKLPWKPNLNDGVLITASPLWKLFRLTKWQKDLKACWDDLEAGEYDWAHLAHSIWPQRVEKACETDRSIAIAHGLEHLCKVEPPKPKKKRAKKAAEDESKAGEPELI